MKARTQGKWEAVEVGSTGGENPMPVFDIVAGGRVRVAECVIGDDARLIAAAPDLYEALAKLLHEYEGAMKSDYDFLGVPITTVEMARAALSRATGETK